jgi:hypothetical protein
MKTETTFCVAALLALVATGCSTIKTTTTAYAGSPNCAPVDPSGVQLLRHEPLHSHERLAEITLDASGEPSTGKMEARMRGEAAKVGADAVVVVFDRLHPGGLDVPGGLWARGAEAIDGHALIGVAVKYHQ